MGTSGTGLHLVRPWNVQPLDEEAIPEGCDSLLFVSTFAWTPIREMGRT
jgi:hypothetical protein